MAEKTNLNDVMKELKTIKNLILRDLQIDTEDIKLDKKGLQIGKKTINTQKKIFDCIDDWKIHIWDDCKNKKIVKKRKEFDYDCKLTEGACKFEYCPLNIKKE